MKFSFPLSVSVTTAILGWLTSSVPSAVVAEELLDIPGTAVAAEIFTTLVAALTAADLVEALSNPPNEGPLTVFAPSDAAFALLPEELVPCLLEPTNQAVLQDILLYHVADGLVLAADLTDGQQITTLEGQTVTVDLSDGVMINDSTVFLADVRATNGVIHAIDQVLVPLDVDVTAFLETCSDDPTPSKSGKKTKGNIFKFKKAKNLKNRPNKN